MKRTLVLLAATLAMLARSAAESTLRGDEMLANYFQNETARLTIHCLEEIRSSDDWKSHREEYRRQLREMLGLWPMPERTDLHPVVTGKIEQEDFRVERVQFQAAPQLYVTANLYLPKSLAKPAPAILYLCGHSRSMVTNGVSLGNKTGYQHHGAWFARNGYVCLVVDSLELGEIQGVHSGTRALGRWWWNSRGYTPAGVESWFGIRALDYLCGRPEVDAGRIGLTGRSGGGSYTWTVAALDDRVKVACPIAGMTDLQNHIVDGCIDGHCDCMFFMNTYRWDFPQVAALIAPRPLLIGNSDKDKIFPLDGVMRLHEKVHKIYRLYGATEQLSILITDGPHKDTQELQLPVLRWFNRFLKGEEPLVETAARKFFAPEQLRVFGELPADAVNANLPTSSFPPGSRLGTEAHMPHERLIATLREKSFGGWPTEPIPLETKLAFSATNAGVKLSAWDFMSQPDVRLRLYLVEPPSASAAQGVSLTVLDLAGWTNWLGAMCGPFATELSEELAGAGKRAPNTDDFTNLRRRLGSESAVLAFLAPRGVGLTAWSGEEKRRTGIRRRFMLLGQTLDGMRVWDIRRGVQTVRAVRSHESTKVELCARGEAAVNCLYAALFEPVQRLELTDLPLSQAKGPDYLNILRVADLPQVLEQATTRAEVVVRP